MVQVIDSLGLPPPLERISNNPYRVHRSMGLRLYFWPEWQHCSTCSSPRYGERVCIWNRALCPCLLYRIQIASGLDFVPRWRINIVCISMVCHVMIQCNLFHNDSHTYGLYMYLYCWSKAAATIADHAVCNADNPSPHTAVLPLFSCWELLEIIRI